MFASNILYYIYNVKFHAFANLLIFLPSQAKHIMIGTYFHNACCTK